MIRSLAMTTHELGAARGPTSSWQRIVCIAICLSCTIAVPRAHSLQPEPDGWQRWVSDSAARLPRTGAWVATFESEAGVQVDRRQVSYDWGTRAWALVTGTGASGRGPNGERAALIGSPPGAPLSIHSELMPLPASPLPGDDAILDRYLSAPLLRALTDQPQNVKALVPLEEGGVRVTLTRPGGSRDENKTAGHNPPLPQLDVILDFDSLGRVIRQEAGEGAGHFVWQFEYDERSPTGFPCRMSFSSTVQTVAGRGTALCPSQR